MEKLLLHATEQRDIDGLGRGVWMTGDAAGILHIIYPLIQSGRDNLLQNTRCIQHFTSFLKRAWLVVGTLHINISNRIKRGWFYTHAETEAYIQYEELWLNGSGTSLSLHIQSRLLLTPPAVYLLSLKVHTHHKTRIYSSSLPSPPLWGDWGVRNIAGGYIHSNLHKS